MPANCPTRWTTKKPGHVADGMKTKPSYQELEKRVAELRREKDILTRRIADLLAAPPTAAGSASEEGDFLQRRLLLEGGINAMLHAALAPRPLAEFLPDCLRILAGLLPAPDAGLPRGFAVLLCAKDGRIMELAAAVGMSPAEHAFWSRMSPTVCTCGRAIGADQPHLHLAPSASTWDDHHALPLFEDTGKILGLLLITPAAPERELATCLAAARTLSAIIAARS